MNKNNNEISLSPPASGTRLERRHFLSSALTAGLLATAAGAQTPASRDETPLFVPTPADALIDVLGYLGGLESEVLGQYYVILGDISAHIRRNYETLKKAVGEFKRLVPAIASSDGVSRLGHLSDVGILSASLLQQILMTGPVSESGNQLAFANVKFTELQRAITTSEIPGQSITLSPEAVTKLREIFTLIESLNKPTASLDTLSALLTHTSNELRKKAALIRPLMVDAIQSLLASDFLDQPTSAEALATVVKRLKESKRPETSAALRQRAIKNLAEIQVLLDSLSSVTVPDQLKEYVREQGRPPSESQGIPAAVLLQLLTAIATWIEKPDKMFTRNGSGSTSGGVFVKVGLGSPAWPGQALARKIYDVLVNLIPEPNQDRLDRLFWKKVALSIYSEEEQYRIFFNILPKLPELGEHDLYNDQLRRETAARKLARISLI